MYKKISVIANEEDAEDVREELNDRFGEIPRATENLLDVALIKAQAHRKYITEISGGSGSYRISMLPNAKIDTFKMHGFLSRHSGILRFVMEKNPYFIYKPKVPCRTLEQEMKALRDLFDMMEEIMQK